MVICWYMKKYIIVLVFIGILAIPSVSRAQSVNSGVLIPLLQQLIGLLQNRVVQLTNEVQTLKQSCSPTLGSLSQKDKVRKEYALKINEIEKQIVVKKQEGEKAQSWLDTNSSKTNDPIVGQMVSRVINIYRDTVTYSNQDITRLENEKQALQVELSRILIELGEF